MNYQEAVNETCFYFAFLVSSPHLTHPPPLISWDIIPTLDYIIYTMSLAPIIFVFLLRSPYMKLEIQRMLLTLR